MRKIVVLVPLTAALALVGFFFFKPASSPAQPWPKSLISLPRQAEPAKPTPAAQAAELPIARVILYSSGVGYFERQSHIDGNARLDLSFPVQDVNDLLKSMVLQDLGGGHISAVSYDSHEPIDKTLNSFAVNLTANPSFTQILSQARGEKVEVVLKNKASIPGTVIGVDLNQPLPDGNANPRFSGNGPALTASRVYSTCYSPKRNPDGVISLVLESKDNAADSDVLNLWCPDGMRSVQVKDIERIRFLNPKMEEEIRRALEVLASAHDTQKKTVTLNFSGEGRRQVKVGYVVENPLWRTSYRLLVGKDGKLFLQGWAVVENPSNEDWKDVRMSLVSGQPISFKMDLYQPLYVNRPVVQPELFASIRPQTHDGAMVQGLPPGFAMPGNGQRIQYAPVYVSPTMQWAVPRSMVPPNGPPALAAAPPPPGSSPPVQTSQPPGYPQAAYNQATPAPQAVGQPQGQNQNINLPAQSPNFWSGVMATATAAELGNFFQYKIEHPVTVPRQKSAMLPIVNKALAGAKVSVFNQNTHAKYPLLALHLKNTTGLHLMQGPITVFEGASYAGDALLGDLEPGEERLVSYAIDTGTEVEPVATQAPERLISLRLHKSVLTATMKLRQSTTYNVKNRSTHERVLLIEHPVHGDYKLVSKDKPKERTREVYRFELKVPAGKSARLEVAEENDQVQSLAMANFNADLIRFYLQGKYKNAKVQESLQTALAMQQALAKFQTELAGQRQQLQAITQDQERLRANLKEMPSSSAAYKRYLQKFDTQETEIEKLQERIKALQAEEHQQRQAYESFLGQIDVESTIVSWPSVGRPEPTPMPVTVAPPGPAVYYPPPPIPTGPLPPSP